MSGLLLFAQVVADGSANVPAPIAPPADWLRWFYVWGEPSVTLGRSWGGLVSWSKVVGLYCLLAWVIGWLITASRSNTPGAKTSKVRLGLVLAVIGTGLLAALFGVLEETGLLKLVAIAGTKPAGWLAVLSGLILLALVETQLWGAILKSKSRADFLCLVAVHAVFVLGFVIGGRWDAWNQLNMASLRSRGVAIPEGAFPDWRLLGARIGGTYMGLVVLARVVWLVVGEVMAIRLRRIYSIAWQSVAEANRTNRAPYVVLSVFVVVLAFTHWFLRSGERDAELSRVFVGALTLLCSILLLAMIVFIAPISMPRDIQNQTIYTIVSKPVRRLELIWGRLVGYMALVTVLLVIFGAVSLLYLSRTVGYRVGELRAEAKKFETIKPDYAKLSLAAADQLEGRMSARVPLKGPWSSRTPRTRSTSAASMSARSRRCGRSSRGPRSRRRSGGTRSSATSCRRGEAGPDAPGRQPAEAGLDRGPRRPNHEPPRRADGGRAKRAKGGVKASDVTRTAADNKAKEEEVAALAKELDALRAREKGVRDEIAKLPKAEQRAARTQARRVPLRARSRSR